MFNQRKPMRARMSPNGKKAGYDRYHRYCPYYWHHDDWYYDDWYYDDYDGYYDDESYYDDYLYSATQDAFKAGVKQGMKKARMMWDKNEPQPVPPPPPEPQIVTTKGE